MNNLDISIIIPCYNEENIIASNINFLFYYLSKNFNAFEIICIDDGSTDDTFLILNNLKLPKKSFKILKNKENKGKGHSVRKGILSSSGNSILFMDADLSTDLDEIPKIMNLLNDFDLVIGSRHSKDSLIMVKQPFYRRISAFLFHFISNKLLGLDFKDSQCGFKAFKRDVAIDIFSKQKIDRFAFDVEILYLAKLMNHSVGILPIHWSNNKNSSVKIFRDSVNMFFDIIKLKKIHSNDL